MIYISATSTEEELKENLYLFIIQMIELLDEELVQVGYLNN